MRRERAVATVGEAARPRSAPAYSRVMSAASGTGAPVTVTPGVEVVTPRVLAPADEGAADGGPAGAGGSLVQAPRTSSDNAAAVVEMVRGRPRITLQP